MLSRLSSTGVGVRTAWCVVQSSHRLAFSWGLIAGLAPDVGSAPVARAWRYSSNERCRSVALALSSSAVSGATSIVIIRWLILSPRFQAESYSQSYPGQDLTATGHTKPHTLPGSQGWIIASQPARPGRINPLRP